MSARDLPTRIIELSRADTWKAAANEWELSGIEILDAGESDECLCGHKPIRELCHITNRVNGNTAIVGNHCIAKFHKEHPDLEIFESASLIHQAALRILKDPTASANEQLINFAERKRVFKMSDARFYREIWRKRKLKNFQQVRKNSLNQQLLYGLILSSRGAYQRLKLDPKEGTAGPKLIDYAFSRAVLREKDTEFYLDIWERSHDSLTVRQKAYKEDLNQKILSQLREFLDGGEPADDLSQEIVG